ncbi:MAG: DUF3168 domain-containing protein [Solirubrobacterales bacterium]
MARIDTSVRARLIEVTAVTDIVPASRIYPLKLPQNPTFPAITYRVISDVPEYDLEGEAGLSHARIQIDCYGASSSGEDPYDVARALGLEVRAALSAYQGTVDGVEFQTSFVVGGPRTVYADRLEQYFESIDFRIGYALA